MGRGVIVGHARDVNDSARGSTKDPWAAPRSEHSAPKQQALFWMLALLPGVVALTVGWTSWPDYSECLVSGPLGGLDLLVPFVAHVVLLVAASYAVLLITVLPRIRQWTLTTRTTLALALLVPVSLGYVAVLHGPWPAPTPECKNSATHAGTGDLAR